VNCAGLPETLLESELFGHVKGAFTGADVTKKGKFALANGGSILLDEIGTMGATLQAKLLRVLQEREIEPLGSERTERVDVRVMAATNRNLGQLMTEKRFLEDLYYRLNVIPLKIAPLRERAEDIPLLMAYFLDKHATRNDRSIEAVDDEVVSRLQEYHWPGNVRELENAMERAVVLTRGATITREVIMLGATADSGAPHDCIPSLELHQNVEWAERETIRRALAVSTEKRHAASLLGISPRALSHYLMKHSKLDQARARPDAELVGRANAD